MKLTPSDPDLKTIVDRINAEDIDLQPDFQRGEVWSESKQKRLIDSILRNWHVPPIHVVLVEKTGRQEVLDGQQRLVAIRDFVRNKFPIDGSLEPSDPTIEALDGCYYKGLPPERRRKFDQFPVRVYTITDYGPSEPGELFFRLNQPTTLTTAETRNALYGQARNQVKRLVTEFDRLQINEESIGFSNARMAYDDTIARFCFVLENRTLWQKVTAAAITEKYRSTEGFESHAVNRARRSIEAFARTISVLPKRVRYNKATLFTWLCVFAELIPMGGHEIEIISEFMKFFEYSRTHVDKVSRHGPLLLVFNDRASSRVADTSSVIVRDFVAWFFLDAFLSANGYGSALTNDKLTKVGRIARSIPARLTTAAAEGWLELATLEHRWGEEL